MVPAIAYAGAAGLATLVGGSIPFLPKLKRLEFRYLVAFAAGVTIATAFFEMLPEVGSVGGFTAISLGAGFFMPYFIEKTAMIHACGEAECEEHVPAGWVAMVGISTESLLDGVAIAAGYLINPALALAIAVAVAIHELPRGLSTTVIMRNSGYGSNGMFLGLGVDALFTPLGALAFSLLPAVQSVATALLALTVGMFIYIGASDLLPEAHRRFNAKVVSSVLAGAAMMLAVGWIAG